MRLKIKQLSAVVKTLKNDEKIVETLRGEVSRVLGPSVLTRGDIHTIAEHVNDRVNVMVRTGKTNYSAFKPSSVLPFVRHNDPEVRMMAANLIPERFLFGMHADKDSSVRAAVARRVNLSTVKEMMKKFPTDDQLMNIYRHRSRQRLNEVSDANVTTPFDLTDEWYHTTAFDLCGTYDKEIESGWEEKVVGNLVRHTKATSGVEIDSKKLLDAIIEIKTEKDERALERDALKELSSVLRSQTIVNEGHSYTSYRTLPWTSDNDRCEHCDKVRLTKNSYINGSYGHYCSSECYEAAELDEPNVNYREDFHSDVR